MSLRKAINAMCKNCIHDPVGGIGGWREQVKNCTAKTCPLFDVRPKPSQTIGNDLIVLKKSEMSQYGGNFDGET